MLGETYPELQDELELLPGVWEVLRVSKPYKLATREFVPDDTVVRIGGGEVAVGGGSFVVFAGPCAVESEDQVIATARAAAAVGADGLIIEVHPNPDVAKCDGSQSLTFENFSTLMGQINAIRTSMKSEAAV